MGMPVTVEIVDAETNDDTLAAVFDYFAAVDRRFSTYKPRSEISRINRGELAEKDWSAEMKTVLKLCEQTKEATDGYFDIQHDEQRDPSGLVKGWAIKNAADLLKQRHLTNYYVDAGGDIQVNGLNSEGRSWQVGIRNPFNREEIIKTLAVTTEGVATSGTYIRGQHIYNPLKLGDQLDQIASLTVIGPDVYEADRFATAAYAMGPKGIHFIEALPGFEGYAVDGKGLATMTSGFERYTSV